LPDSEKKEAQCPICDSKVDPDAAKCPECKADLTLFGVKMGDEEIHEDIEIPDEESIEALLGAIGKKDGKKENDLFDEIMAAVDKTDAAPSTSVAGEPMVDEKIEEVVEEVAQDTAPQAEAVMFECPLCNTLVSEDANKCPGCGAIFAESEEEAPVEGGAETATQEPATIEAQPEMQEAIPSEPRQVEMKGEEIAAAQPPSTAVSDEKALRKELTQCVGEVKPLLAGARQFGINVLKGRKLIDKAIAAGKKRDFQVAIDLVRESQSAIENNFKQHIDDTVSGILTKLKAIEKAGGDTSGLDDMVKQVKALSTDGKIIEGARLAKSTSERTEQSILRLKSTLKEKHSGDDEKDVNGKVADLVDLIKSGEEVKVNVKGAITLLTQARMAIKKAEYSQAEEYLIQAKEDFLKELPKQITDIISNSKPMLYKAKMQGVDIRPSIKLLKEASTALKLNNYLDALDAIKRYRAEMNQYMGES
jgi:hypothetical protein